MFQYPAAPAEGILLEVVKPYGSEFFPFLAFNDKVVLIPDRFALLVITDPPNLCIKVVTDGRDEPAFFRVPPERKDEWSIILFYKAEPYMPGNIADDLIHSFLKIKGDG